MNLYRFLILAALIFALGCGGGSSTATAPKSSSGSEFSKFRHDLVTARLAFETARALKDFVGYGNIMLDRRDTC